MLSNRSGDLCGMFAGTGSFWREGRGEYPGRSAGDAGMVPLSSRETAKDGEQGTQLAALKQVSHLLQRILPRAKRKPAPGIQARLCPETHRRWELTELKARGYSLNSGSKLL